MGKYTCQKSAYSDQVAYSWGSGGGGANTHSPPCAFMYIMSHAGSFTFMSRDKLAKFRSYSPGAEFCWG